MVFIRYCDWVTWWETQNYGLLEGPLMLCAAAGSEVLLASFDSKSRWGNSCSQVLPLS